MRSDKNSRALRVAAIATLVLMLLCGAMYWLFVYNSNSRPLDTDEFKDLATVWIRPEPDFPPLQVTAYPDVATCEVQKELIPHGLAAAASTEGQSITLRLFDSNESALRFVNNIEACWAENGLGVVDRIDHVVENRVDIFSIEVSDSALGVTEAFVAVYRNVYVYTATHSELWHPWVTVASTRIKAAIDQAAR